MKYEDFDIESIKDEELTITDLLLIKIYEKLK